MAQVDLKNPLMVALDVDDGPTALSFVKNYGNLVGSIKLGPRLTVRFGPEFIAKVAEYAPVFIDHKYFGIPSTMLGAVQASFEAGASFVTVHALSGSPTLRELGKLEKKLNEIRPFQILCVTILTSFSQEDLPSNLSEVSIQSHVETLSTLVHEAGLQGLVCSPHEVESLRGLFSNAFLVTPGVRFSEDSKGDQSRTMTPYEAIRAGASALVVGRPIVQSPDPRGTIEKIISEINRAGLRGES